VRTRQAIRRKRLGLLRQSAITLQVNARLHITSGTGTALPCPTFARDYFHPFAILRKFLDGKYLKQTPTGS